MAGPKRTLWPGRPYPLGAVCDGEGINFALFSENAEGVTLCLFDREGRHELEQIPLREHTDQIWHGYLPGEGPGLVYGYRVDGPYDPESGHRFNRHKLLLDPYAKRTVGSVDWSDAHFGYRVGDEAADLSFDERDNAARMPKAVTVGAGDFDWEGDTQLGTPWHETIIYEAHVKGLTHQHPEVPAAQRGTYAGLASPVMIDHLRRLGVTTVELMPIHAFVDDRILLDKGLRNYWGYNTIGYFAPDSRYASNSAVIEFKEMVKALHHAGLEVILDVVYNHTAEGSEMGPTLSFRGIDNASYYRLVPENPRYYFDYTGTGNTLNMMHPRVLQLIMDSLRYWVLEMHVDGFRFDLAAALARELHEVDRLGAFFDIINQDPVLSQVKLIAEPWDLGEGGYQVGNFPVGWTEWNGCYRDTLRAFWKGDEGLLGDLAYRLTGSSDLYENDGRRPFASINFITAHDGFTLQDLVSYNERHNEANGEGNRDGTEHNISWNCGEEGPSEDPEVLACRARQKRNFLASLLLSQGVPMLLAGDEFGRSQQGNNNGYCQDNEITWLDWDLSEEQRQQLEFVQDLIRLRRDHCTFRRRHFFQGERVTGRTFKDIVWLSPDGEEMADEAWDEPFVPGAVGLYLSGEGLREYNQRGERLRDDDFVLLLNGSASKVDFLLPRPHDRGKEWRLLLDTAHGWKSDTGRKCESGGTYPLEAHSMAVLTREL